MEKPDQIAPTYTRNEATQVGASWRIVKGIEKENKKKSELRAKERDAVIRKIKY